jgi:hypothetical protein
MLGPMVRGEGVLAGEEGGVAGRDELAEEEDELAGEEDEDELDILAVVVVISCDEWS